MNDPISSPVGYFQLRTDGKQKVPVIEYVSFSSPLLKKF